MHRISESEISKAYPDFHISAPLLHMAIMLGKEPQFQDDRGLHGWLFCSRDRTSMPGDMVGLSETFTVLDGLQDSVCHAYYASGRPSAHELQCKILVTVAAQRSSEDRRVETSNLSVNALSLGYLSTLLFWGVLIKVERDAGLRSGARESTFCAGKETYKAAPWSEKLQANVKSVIRAAEAMNKLCQNVPRTLEAYSAAVQELEKSGDLKFPGAKNSNYLRPWVTRMRLVTEMRFRGVKRLKFSPEAPLALLHDGFPDHKVPGRGSLLCETLVYSAVRASAV